MKTRRTNSSRTRQQSSSRTRQQSSSRTRRNNSSKTLKQRLRAAKKKYYPGYDIYDYRMNQKGEFWSCLPAELKTRRKSSSQGRVRRRT
jgi:hypothetical protein